MSKKGGSETQFYFGSVRLAYRTRSPGEAERACFWNGVFRLDEMCLSRRDIDLPSTMATAATPQDHRIHMYIVYSMAAPTFVGAAIIHTPKHILAAPFV